MILTLMLAALQMQEPLISTQAKEFSLTANPKAKHWKKAKPVVTNLDRYGVAIPGARTEVRSVWTPKFLSFLFISHFETQYLKPNPEKVKETPGMWDYDVVEIFLGPDVKNVGKYLEFEVSPQDEWVDLDCDKSRKGSVCDIHWDAGMEYRNHVDLTKKVWVSEIRLPWKAIDQREPKAGNDFTLNLYRIEGKDPRKYITWQPVQSPSFHTPERFGRLILR
jgi:hypothetical protein